MKKIAACILALFAVSALAEDVIAPAIPVAVPLTSVPSNAPLTDAERQKIRDEVLEMRTRAAQMRAAIEKEYIETQKACWKRFLVSRCQDEAKIKRRDAMEEVRRIEAEARDKDRDLRRREAADREAKRERDEPLREAKARERAERNRLEREAAQAKVAEKQSKPQ